MKVISMIEDEEVSRSPRLSESDGGQAHISPA